MVDAIAELPQRSVPRCPREITADRIARAIEKDAGFGMEQARRIADAAVLYIIGQGFEIVPIAGATP